MIPRRVLLASILPFFIMTAAFPARAMPVDLALVLAVDVSDSIDATESRLQRQGYADAFRRPDILDAIRGGRHGRIAVAYFEWADATEQEVIVDWMIVGDAASAKSFGDRLHAGTLTGGHFTSISAAISYAVSLLKKLPFEADRKVIDISGDGRNNDGPPLSPARKAAAALDVTINGLPIDNERSRIASDMLPGQIASYYRDEVIAGPGAFIVVAKDFADFERAITRKLLREIAGNEPDGSGGTTTLRRTAARQ